jgi:hypothetical protein
MPLVTSKKKHNKHGYGQNAVLKASLAKEKKLRPKWQEASRQGALYSRGVEYQHTRVKKVTRSYADTNRWEDAACRGDFRRTFGSDSYLPFSEQDEVGCLVLRICRRYALPPSLQTALRSHPLYKLLSANLTACGKWQIFQHAPLMPNSPPPPPDL